MLTVLWTLAREGGQSEGSPEDPEDRERHSRTWALAVAVRSCWLLRSLQLQPFASLDSRRQETSDNPFFGSP